MSLGTELKQFLLRGNVADMAVGIVIGAAFGKIVTSFVNDILMPPIALLLGNTQFDQLKLVLREAVVSGDKITHEAITWNYGAFIQTVVDFLIVGTAIFFVIKAMNRLSSKKPEAPAAPPAPSKEEQLLTEIRDLLKKE
ncbi:large-conductance mechanosensitive channel protein MscL [Seramator thermalis]|jgi:large conductance mechanosensitive channel|uniref:large-conductance mechanosensitive channel protein MscL n=1 Tax=Seramator thermalis TaxID=2496270 RepID=UPI0009D1866D|nr:large-conductance mechanosensitive channel protein MscL [Seramator thermalis]MBP7179530.1 large-conductance mechanosensitive channel protein MscL [Dysgonamonadaceae bacterium]OPZ15625.1 MAG: Large-conductance mechanosensitive channel [Bacteroidetes bacterium ADurb.BinA261]MBP9031483.1 large-conductance mechanosensitive channel protein MscL [Dysgonamonadaceae bacterium]HPD44164.1 large-conductance mechanosensitive channel protein MscL [Dysgonamonadaceae bacterium]HQG07928.1 large-conductance